MQDQVTLEFVAAKLNLWRANKPTPYSKIPQNIKDLIKSVGQRHSYTQLSKALKIYGASLTNIIRPSNTKINKIDFIELPTIISSPNKPPISTNTTCTLRHPNGTTMVIKASTQQLTTIVKNFICYN
jgi:hypothetical protein